jgi:thymidylate synthase (FAD)
MMLDFDLWPSISQESMRYVDMNNAEYVCPLSIGNKDKLRLKFSKHMKRSWELYRELREAGVKKEDARYVLPIAAASRLVLTMNFSAWLHFCEVRCSPQAQWEIRGVAMQVLRQLHERAPSVFGELWHRV